MAPPRLRPGRTTGWRAADGPPPRPPRPGPRTGRSSRAFPAPPRRPDPPASPLHPGTDRIDHAGPVEPRRVGQLRGEERVGTGPNVGVGGVDADRVQAHP